MQYNVLQYLERDAAREPDRIAVIDAQERVTYADLLLRSQRTGRRLLGLVKPGAPAGVFMTNGIPALTAFFGIVYAGGCYCLMNPELPDSRLAEIREVLGTDVIITSEEYASRAAEIFPDASILMVEKLTGGEAMTGEAGEMSGRLPADLAAVRARAIDTDPLYINFTSGSTGVPKGIAVSHRSVIDFMSCFPELMGIGSEDIIANQAPFDFDVSVKDIYATLTVGATLVIVPRQLFSQPAPLVDFLCEQKVTTLIWAVSALCLVTTFHALDYRTPGTVNKILFSGEVMPVKHLMQWRRHLPHARFVNLYGPTEITCNCTYHILEEGRDYSEGIPIGRPFPNERVFLLEEGDRLITKADEDGEICVTGSALALGYYRNEPQNGQHFVQNPLNEAYPQRIYRTGDLAHYNDRGELVYAGRRDFQIKYQGHRIELEEVERAMAGVEGVERCCCLYDAAKSRLLGFYVGSIDRKQLHAAMEANVPAYMIPGRIRQVDAMPLTKNGKIDRRVLMASTERRKK